MTGKDLLAKRLELGFSQTEMATACMVTKHTIRRYENKGYRKTTLPERFVVLVGLAEINRRKSVSAVELKTLSEKAVKRYNFYKVKPQDRKSKKSKNPKKKGNKSVSAKVESSGLQNKKPTSPKPLKTGIKSAAKAVKKVVKKK